MTRGILILTLAMALQGCRSLEVQAGLPDREQIPANAEFVYRFEPSLLSYHYTDSTSGQLLELRWLYIPERPFIGYTCIGLVPDTPADSAGRFVFVARASNLGLLERTSSAGVDTTTAYFVASGQGSRGRYALDSQGTLTLAWSNGRPSRYFDPRATLRIAGDSLIADADLQERDGLIRAIWHVVWLRGACA